MPDESRPRADDDVHRRDHGRDSEPGVLPAIPGYEFERKIGRGGSATVYLAREIKHDRQVAVKLLHPALAASLQAERFLREIAITAKLAHPNILPLLDSGSVADQLYFVTPYVSGESLRRRLERDGRLPVEDAVRLTREIADALDYAHRQGLVHRDVKPENILLADGHALVADFGIARALSLAADDRLTTAGLALGTPRYMSPEQASGSATLDGRSDVYSLGCVFFELLTGHAPFTGETATQIIHQHLHEPVPSLRGLKPPVPPHLQRILVVALAKRAPDRFASAAQMSEALVGELPTPGWLSWLPQWTRRTFREHPIGTAAIVSAAALALYAVASREIAVMPWTPAHPAGDTTRLALFPVGDSAVRTAVAGQTGMLYEAIAAWRGVSLVDQFRVAEGVERSGGRITVGKAARLAASLGAGRFILVRATPVGDSSRIYATLYDVRGLAELNSKTSTIPNAPAQAATGFAQLAQQLLLREAPGDSMLSAPLGSSQLPAVQAFALAQLALSRWDLEEADSSLRASLSYDPMYVRANLWLAQVRVWRGLLSPDWSSLASRAQAGETQLTPRERELVQALVHLGAGRFADACRVYDAMRRRNETDFIAWYGLGQCRSLDRGVVRDPTSPSSWRMRSSIHAATLAYAKAFEVLPVTYAGYELDDFDGLRSLLYVGTRLIPARAVPPDTGDFLARLALRDTLVLVPYPFKVVISGGAASVPPGFTEALSDRVAAFSRVATGWSAAFPNRAGPKHAVAIALEMQGSRAAIDTFVLARRLTSDPTRRARLAAREVLVRLRHADPENLREWRLLRALADSQLSSTTWSQTAAATFAPLAAITGHCDVSERLSRLTTATRGVVPQHLMSALDLHLSRAAMGCSAGPTGLTVSALARLFDDESRSLGTREQSWLRAAMVRPALLAPPVDSTLVNSLVARGDSTPLMLAASAIAAHDTVAAKAHLGAASQLAQSGLTTPDMAFLAANLSLAAGDTSATLIWLDKVLSERSTYDYSILSESVKAAALVRCMILRADIAAQTGDRQTARRWGAVVATLWGGADAELQPVVRRMTRYAGRG